MVLTYIGCGTDFTILPLFPTVKLFIYIDSLPSSAYGLLFYDDKSMYDHSYLNKFAKTIPKQFTKISFKNEYPDVYYNHMSGQTLIHAYDLPYPLPTTQTQTSTIVTTDDINNINKLVANTTHLLVKGYHPHVSIFTHIHTKKITFIADSNTYYPSHKSKLDDEDVDKAPTHLLFNTNNIRNRISDIIYIDKNNIHKYTNYDDFLLHML
jgi:hypothetical protein